MALETQTGSSIAASSNSTDKHHQIVVVGGGSAGISVAAGLMRQNSKLDVAIIEPSDKHFYQPAWTLVGAGSYRLEDTVRPEKEVLPPNTTWIQEAVSEFDPDSNLVITQGGTRIRYDYLVVCPGIQINWDGVKGLPEALGKDGVCSNYSYQHVTYTWDAIRNFKGGNAIFTFPATPIKCPGAPQKVMYLADDAFRQNGVRDRSKIMFCSAGAAIFSVKAYADTLMQVVARKGIDLKFKHNLKEIKAATKEAVFDVTTDNGVEEVVLSYDLLHVAPPMSPPDFVKNSKLAVADGPSKGWVDVNKETLQHNIYPNVFSLGDASSLPTSKTAAAIRRQAPLLIQNLLAQMAAQPNSGHYDGYTCCPLITGYGKTIMAEFDYSMTPRSSFPMDPTKERYSMWLAKKKLIPWLYWNRLIKGIPF